MASKMIGRLLGRLRRRERFLATSWTAARVLCVVALLLAAACLLDWWIDRRRETPYPLRVGLLAVQVVAWVALAFTLLRVLFRRAGEDELALLVEEKVPDLNHRLISAVQFDRPGAKTEGMSPDLIRAVTEQADERAATISASQVLSWARLRTALLVVAPVVIAAVAVFLVAPITSAALLERVFLADRDIPRSISLEPSDHHWAAGEEGTLTVRVVGPVAENDTGETLLEFEDGTTLRLALVCDEGERFVTKVPANDIPFRYRAWLNDSRTRTPGNVTYSPRPVVQSIVAFVDLPVDRIGTQAGGSPFYELQRGGDIAYRLAGSRARLDIAAQVPISEARVRVEGKKSREVVVKPAEASARFTASFPLLPEDTGYSISVTSANGFAGREAVRRTIRRLPLEPPVVALMLETFWKEGDDGSPEDREVEGIPILLGERCRIDYQGADRYGLSHARLRFRVVPRVKDGDEATTLDPDSFQTLPLGAGRNPKVPISPKAREEFATQPAAYPGALPDSEGQGRYDFSSVGIPDGKGGLVKLVEGDRIQFYVEMFGKADPDGKPGRSAIREKEIIGLSGYLGWLKKKDDLAERTRILEAQQRGARPGESD
jgi:hypothetical protein